MSENNTFRFYTMKFTNYYRSLRKTVSMIPEVIRNTEDNKIDGIYLRIKPIYKDGRRLFDTEASNIIVKSHNTSNQKIVNGLEILRFKGLVEEYLFEKCDFFGHRFLLLDDNRFGIGSVGLLSSISRLIEIFFLIEEVYYLSITDPKMGVNYILYQSENFYLLHENIYDIEEGDISNYFLKVYDYVGEEYLVNFEDIRESREITVENPIHLPIDDERN